MPELPEVEVVRRSLQKFIIGKKIKKIEILNKNLRYKIDKKLKKVAENQKVVSTKRKSKYLLIELSNKHTILLHLGMTGKIFILKNNKVFKTSFYYEKLFYEKHNHFIFNFNKSEILIYNDVRKFGFIKIFKTKNVKTCSHIKNLGPDPLSEQFNSEYMKRTIPKIKKNIKNFLMDQKYVSGIGNIYANEIIHLSTISPRKKVYNLSAKKISLLVKNVKKILKEAIRFGCSSIKDFRGIGGDKGNFQQKFRVYNREGCTCKKKACGGLIKKIYISNRSSFFCSICQNN